MSAAKFFFRDSDKCLKDSADGWKDWTCASATNSGKDKRWCSSYARDMLRCCPVSCYDSDKRWLGVLTPMACHRLPAGSGSCLYRYYDNGDPFIL